MSGYPRNGNIMERVSVIEERGGRHGGTFDYDPEDRPGKPTQVGDGLEYFIREKKTDLWFNGVVHISSLLPDTCAGDMEMYECQMRPMEKNELDEWVPVDHFKVLKEYFFVNDPEDIPDAIRFNFKYLDHPKAWGWQWRARGIVKQSRNIGLWGPSEDAQGWSDTYDAPWYDALPLPPPPDVDNYGMYLTVYKNPEDRNEPRWACKVEHEEIGPWDIPPVDPGKEKAQKEDDIDEYEYVLRFCDKNENFLTFVDDEGKTRFKERKHRVKAKDQDDNDFVRYIFENLKRKHYFKVKARSIDRFRRKGLFGPFTAVASGTQVNEFVPKVRHPVTGAVGDFLAYLDEQVLYLKYDYPQDTGDEDDDIKDPDPDVVGVQIQVSDRADFDKALSNIWSEERNYAGMKWKDRFFKPNGTLWIRIRCRNSSGTKGEWTVKSVVTKVPPVPDTLVTVDKGKMKGNKNNKWWAQGEFSYNEAFYDEDRIDRWVLLIQVNSTNAGHTAGAGWGNDPEDRKVFHEKDKRSNGKFRHKFRKLVAKDWVSMAFFVADKQGRTSPVSDWSAPVRLTSASGPQKPTNVTRIEKHRKVGIKGKKPMDADLTWLPDTNIVEYRVQRATSNTFAAPIDDEYTDTPKKTYDLAVGDKTPYFLRIASVDEEGLQSNWVHDDGTESPPPAGAIADDIDLTDPDVVGILPPDQLPTIPYANFGSLGVSRYGSTSAMNAATAKDGDIWLNTDYTPARPFYRRAGAWNASIDGVVLLAGTVLADAVVAGAIDGMVITGATVQTAGTGSRRIVLAGGSFSEVIRFMNAGSTSDAEIAYSDSLDKLEIENKVLDGDLQLSVNGSGGRIRMNGKVLFDEYSASPTVSHNAGSGTNLPVGGGGNFRPHQWIRVTRESDENTDYYIPAWTA